MTGENNAVGRGAFVPISLTSHLSPDPAAKEGRLTISASCDPTGVAVPKYIPPISDARITKTAITKLHQLGLDEEGDWRFDSLNFTMLLSGGGESTYIGDIAVEGCLREGGSCFGLYGSLHELRPWSSTHFNTTASWIGWDKKGLCVSKSKRLEEANVIQGNLHIDAGDLHRNAQCTLVFEEKIGSLELDRIN